MLTEKKKDRWKLEEGGISWNLGTEKELPHEDHLEMSGKFVSQYVKYNVDSEKTVQVGQILVWPWLRMLPNDTHASMKTMQEKEMVNPTWRVNGEVLPLKGTRIAFDGCLHILESDGTLLRTERSFFPSMEQKAACIRLQATNISEEELSVVPALKACRGTQRGARGIYVYDSRLQPEEEVCLQPGETFVWYGLFAAAPILDGIVWPDGEELSDERRGFLASMKETIALETPDPVLNQMFLFAKIRSMESIFWTRAGLLHSPGGLHYYAAVWANDQAEYANPFFAYTGLENPTESVINCLRLFKRFMGPGFEAIPSSVIAEGESIWEGKKDRGDAAMYAYGTARFLLTMGDKRLAEEYFPAVAWCLEYCRRRLLPEGVVASDSDELEGRFPHGIANLSTSCLLYDALKSASCLARELQEEEKAEEYDRWREELEKSVEEYFGFQNGDYETYRYCRENSALRSWICIPLTVGLFRRKEGTIEALFSERLWTENGLLTMEGDHTFWDRSTVYALRGVFAADKADRGIGYLKEYSAKRLLGEHVPYPVEAWPEGDQRHLSAESALYCRIYLEGLLGLRPEGFGAFTCYPSLPEDWNGITVKNLTVGGEKLSVEIVRKDARYRITVTGRRKQEFYCKEGEEILVRL